MSPLAARLLETQFRRTFILRINAFIHDMAIPDRIEIVFFNPANVEKFARSTMTGSDFLSTVTSRI